VHKHNKTVHRQLQEEKWLNTQFNKKISGKETYGAHLPQHSFTYTHKERERGKDTEKKHRAQNLAGMIHTKKFR
jgi:hypothetical protein